MTAKSFSVRIFVQDGHANGVKIISKSKWSGRGLVIPGESFSKEKDRKELDAPGVCLLLGPTTATEAPVIRIGAADPVCSELSQQDLKSPTWTSAIIFTCKENSLSQTQYQHIASRLVQLGRADEHVKIDDSLLLQKPKLDKTAQSAAETFLAHMLSLYPLLGVTGFVENKGEY